MEPNRLIARFIELPGLIFVLGSFAAFFTAFIPTYSREAWVHIVIGFLSFLFGYVMLRRPKTQEIEKTLIEHSIKNNTDPIRDFEIVSSSTGVTGFFRSLGISGLPLATIAITILFCLLAILSYAINAISGTTIIPDDFPKLVLELSKLTLGAFIGSFVSNTSLDVQRTVPAGKKASADTTKHA